MMQNTVTIKYLVRAAKHTKIVALKIRFLTKVALINTLLTAMTLFSPAAVSQDWVYTVRPGDTLWDLCQAHTTKADCWLRVGPYNGVEYPKNLQPGTRIKFPTAWLIHHPQSAEVVFLLGTGTVLNTLKENQNDALAPMPLTTDTDLNIGDQITLDQGAVAGIKFGDESIMTVNGGLNGATIILDQITMGPNGPITDTKIRLEKGALQTRVPKRQPAIEFEVKTPSVVAAVRGTEFYLNATEDTTLHGVLSGEVATNNPLNDQTVKAGYGLVALNNQPLPKPEALLPPPNILWPASRPPKKPWALTEAVQWEKSPKAKAYVVSAFNENNIAIHTVKTKKDSHQLKKIPLGCYQIRVSAISKSGLKGMYSEVPGCLRQPLPATEAIHIDKGELSWTPVESANHYRVTVLHIDGTQTTLETPAPSLELPKNQTAIEAITVQAINSEDEPGKEKRLQVADSDRYGWLKFLPFALIIIGL